MSKRGPGYADGWCIHYRMRRGQFLSDETCEAGVSYKSLAGEEPGAFNRLPCFLDKGGQPKPDRVHCDKLRLPTTDEINAYEQWITERMDVLRKVMTAIRPWRAKWKGKSHVEVIVCPACNGQLHLSIAAYNGHVHGRCETVGCVSWME